MQFTSRKILGIFLVLIVALLSLASWRYFFDVSLHPDLSNTLLSLLWFSLLGTFFLLGTVVWKSKVLQILGAVFLFLPSFFFIHAWFHLLISLLCTLMAWWSIRMVSREVQERLRFHFIKDVRAGTFIFVFSLSLALSSAYFASIQNASWEELVPRFGVGDRTAIAVFKVVGYFYPEYQKLSEEGMTVDGFLESLQKDPQTSVELRSEPGLDIQELQNRVSSLPDLMVLLEELGQGSLVTGNDALAHELYLRAGRAQIASMAGRPVQGDEKIADVFSLAIQNKIITALSGREASRHLSPQIIPFTLTLLLFLTLLPVGSLVAFVWLFLGFLLFHVVLLLRWVRLETAMKEQRSLAD